jgi:predicted dehydrogenase
MLCATARPTRTLHIVGSGGEIEGDLESSTIKLRIPLLEKGSGFREESIDLRSGQTFTGHGGGDMRLVEDFVRVLRGEPHSTGVTRIEDSLTGHLIAFAAEASRRQSRVVQFDQE